MTAAAWAGLIAAPSQAQEIMSSSPVGLQPGQFYIAPHATFSSGPDVDFGYLETCPMSDGSGGGSEGDCVPGSSNSPFVEIDDNVPLFGGGATFGYVFPTQNASVQQRIEFGFDLLWGDESNSRSSVIAGEDPFDPDSALLLLIGIDGGSFQRCGDLADSPPDCDGDRHMALYNNDDWLDVEAKVRVDHSQQNFGFTYLADIDVSPTLIVTPSVGLRFGHSKSEYDAEASWVDTIDLGGTDDNYGDTVLASLSETVETHNAGLELGTTLTYVFNPSWSVFGGAKAKVIFQRSRLSGHDCLSREYGFEGDDYEGDDPGPVPPSCVFDPEDTVNEDGFETRVKSTQNDVFAGASFETGVNYTFQNGVTLQLAGSAAYQPFMQVKNPSHPHSDDDLPIQEAHLETDHQWSQAVRLSATIPFGGPAR